MMLTVLLVGVLTYALNVASVKSYYEPVDILVRAMPQFPTANDNISVQVDFIWASLPPYVTEFGSPIRFDNTFSINATVFLPLPEEPVFWMPHTNRHTYQLGRLLAGSYQFDVYVLYVHYLEGTYYLAKSLFFNVTIPGDVNRDKIVDIFDIGAISAHWYPGPPIGSLGYHPNSDINNDLAVDIFDIGITSSHWGETW